MLVRAAAVVARFVPLALAASACGQLPDAPLDARYEVIDLGVLRAGDCCSGAVAVNGAGVVAGYSYAYDRGYGRAFRWASGVVTDLGTLGGAFAEATDINATGDIVGWSVDSLDRRLPFLWRGGVMAVIDVRAYCQYQFCGEALAISDSGHVLLSLAPATGDYRARAAIWRNGALQLLPAELEFPRDVNSSGVVVGLTDSYRAVLWAGGATLAEVEVTDPLFYPHALNDAGAILGVSGADPIVLSGTTRERLPGLGGYATVVHAISESGLVAGGGNAENGTFRAVVWNAGEPRGLDLPPGMVGAEAFAVSDAGYVAGLAFGPAIPPSGSVSHATLWRLRP
ncbi:MAG: hypothetical protein A2085_05595 [Gemmatimonadetes bacterium GWC2_71_10]|nr:MAG: hypothetical protein A2085_05595 [Gemmatimonadetes bacterium GWC2_71_10]